MKKKYIPTIINKGCEQNKSTSHAGLAWKHKGLSKEINCFV